MSHRHLHKHTLKSQSLLGHGWWFYPWRAQYSWFFFGRPWFLCVFPQTSLLEFTFTGSENEKKSVASSMSYFVSIFAPLIIAAALRIKDYYPCLQTYMKPEFLIDLKPIKGKVRIDSRSFLHMPSNTHVWIRFQAHKWEERELSGGKIITIKPRTYITLGKYRGSCMVKADCGQNYFAERGLQEKQENAYRWDMRCLFWFYGSVFQGFWVLFCFVFWEQEWAHKQEWEKREMRWEHEVLWGWERMWSKYNAWRVYN